METSNLDLKGKIVPGQQLMVQTKSEILLGTVIYFNAQRQILELDMVKDIKRNFRYTSCQLLSFREIYKITLLENDSDTEDETVKVEQDKLDEKYATVLQKVQVAKISEPSINLNITFDAAELERINQQLDSLVYITDKTAVYKSAIQVVSAQPVVALVIEPNKDERRNGKISVITIATSDTVFIFDMLALKELPELKNLLKSKKTCKAIHTGYQVPSRSIPEKSAKLKAVFDTFIAYSISTNSYLSISLMDAVKSVFDVSKVYNEETVEDHPIGDLYQRPFSVNQRRLLAKAAILQLKLYEYLLFEQMLSNFSQLCDSFSNTLSNDPNSLEVFKRLQSSSRLGFHHLQESRFPGDILDEKY